jgi:hypothetical protein
LGCRHPDNTFAFLAYLKATRQICPVTVNGQDEVAEDGRSIKSDVQPIAVVDLLV